MQQAMCFFRRRKHDSRLTAKKYITFCVFWATGYIQLIMNYELPAMSHKQRSQSPHLSFWKSLLFAKQKGVGVSS